MKKTIIILIAGLLVLLAGAFYYFKNQDTRQIQEQATLEQTLTISQQYASLSYKTEYVLENAEEYQDYDMWDQEMTYIIQQWQKLEADAAILEKSASIMAEEKMTFELVQGAHAYSYAELQKIIEKAPAGKQIRTLAQHLGVDAKRAQLILNQTQDQVTREAYGMEGDVFETCEQNSMRIKNGAKVTVFVGGVVLTGGAAGVAASGVVAKTALVVGGADLVLEVADDEAKIALGDKNKVSEMVGTLRVVTEPAAAILTIANLPQNLTKAADKLGMAIFTGDQLRSVVQDGKIIGISLEPQKNGEIKATGAALTEEELPTWREENNAMPSGETIKETLNIEGTNNTETTKRSKDAEFPEADPVEGAETSDIVNPPETATGNTSNTIAGTYSGSAGLKHVIDDVEAEESLPVTLQLNEAGTGTVNVYGFGGEAHYAGNAVGFSVTMKEDGASVKCVFDGRSSQNGNRVVISGDMKCSMMGITFATYDWSAQK
jgi:hypothetical protein